MADISQINLPDGSSFNVKDATARRDKADKIALPPEYDATSTYNQGDFVIHNDNIYICTFPITTAEAWNSEHWGLVNYDTDYLHSMNPTGAGSFSLNRSANSTIGAFSTAEGYDCVASDSYAHAEGAGTTASGGASHSEGMQTTASGLYSHAEGLETVSSGGNGSHAEGRHTIASGISSHAEGHNTTASGYASHAEGLYTRANHKSQHTFGEYNVLDDSSATSYDRGNYVEIVGNGTATTARSNARTLDWDGNEVLAGRLKVNGTEEVPIVYEVTQSQYDTLKQAGTLVRNALYVITDAQNLNATASDIEYSSGVTVEQAIDSKVSKLSTSNFTLNSATFTNENTSSRLFQINLDVSSTGFAYTKINLEFSTTGIKCAGFSNNAWSEFWNYNKIDTYNHATALKTGDTLQIPQDILKHKLILFRIWRYGYFGSLLFDRADIKDGHASAGVYVYVYTGAKHFTISSEGVITAGTGFGTEGQWVGFIGIG